MRDLVGSVLHMRVLDHRMLMIGDHPNLGGPNRIQGVRSVRRSGVIRGVIPMRAGSEQQQCQRQRDRGARWSTGDRLAVAHSDADCSSRSPLGEPRIDLTQNCDRVATEGRSQHDNRFVFQRVPIDLVIREMRIVRFFIESSHNDEDSHISTGEPEGRLDECRMHPSV